jgi:hypothetical protein
LLVAIGALKQGTKATDPIGRLKTLLAGHAMEAVYLREGRDSTPVPWDAS